MDLPKLLSSWSMAVLGIAVAVLTVCLVYWSGLTGAFLLDDFPNLAVINQLPADATARDFIYLANSGTAGILGRPISVLSFLLQHSAWPDPYYFKLINLILHIVNGGLIAALCLMISKCWNFPPLKPALIFTIALLWMVHPIQVSTVLYVVQRMTILSSSFILIGITGYLLGRYWLMQGRQRIGSFLMIASPLLAAVLGVLCKENGALIYPYLLVIEFTLLANTKLGKRMREIRRWGLLLPLTLGLIAFALYLPTALQGYDIKPFNLLQRVLTEPQALLHYLGVIGLPQPGSFGIYHDDFRLFQTAADLLWALGGLSFIFTALVVAVCYRKRWPLLSFAILWFLAGHALESTVMPLEIYFEHRNYLPLFGPLFALTLLSANYLSSRVSISLAGKGVAALIVIGILSSVTLNESVLWGNPLAQARDAVEHHPQSQRANALLVQTLSSEGEVIAAFEHHQAYTLASGIRISNYIRWLEFSCLMPGITLPDDVTLRRQALESTHDYTSVFSLNNLSVGLITGNCSGLPADKVLLVLGALRQNTAYTISLADLLQLEALLRANQGEYAQAIDLAEQSYEKRPDARTALYKTAWLLQLNDRVAAKAELDFISQSHGDDLENSSILSSQYANLFIQLNSDRIDDC